MPIVQMGDECLLDEMVSEEQIKDRGAPDDPALFVVEGGGVLVGLRELFEIFYPSGEPLIDDSSLG